MLGRIATLAAAEIAKLAVAGAATHFGVAMFNANLAGVAAFGGALAIAGVGAMALILTAWARAFSHWQSGELAQFAGAWVEVEASRRVSATLADFDAEVVDKLANQRLQDRAQALAADICDLLGADEDQRGAAAELAELRTR